MIYRSITLFFYVVLFILLYLIYCFVDDYQIIMPQYPPRVPQMGPQMGPQRNFQGTQQGPQWVPQRNFQGPINGY
jgi:hypothetical protein